MNSIAETIITQRKNLGLTQGDLAELSGVSLRTIKAIENKETNPTLESLNKILDVLGLKITITGKINHV